MTSPKLQHFIEFGGIRPDFGFQYAYCRRPLYCLMDRGWLDTAGWSSFDWQDVGIDAPECLPVGCSHGSDRHGSRAFKNFVWREFDEQEQGRGERLAGKLIAEILKESSHAA